MKNINIGTSANIAGATERAAYSVNIFSIFGDVGHSVVRDDQVGGGGRSIT